MAEESIQDFSSRIFNAANQLLLINGKNEGFSDKNSLPALANYFSCYLIRNRISENIFLVLERFPHTTSFTELLAQAVNYSQNHQTPKIKYCSHCKTNTHNSQECKRKNNIVKCSYYYIWDIMYSSAVKNHTMKRNLLQFPQILILLMQVNRSFAIIVKISVTF